MSWSLSVPSGPVAEFDKAAVAAASSYVAAFPAGALAAETREQIEEAVKAATWLVSSGALGSDHVHATLTGHANPEHKPVPGWSNDSVTISVSYLPAPVEPAPTGDTAWPYETPEHAE